MTDGVRKGEPWGEPPSGASAIAVAGGDAALAGAIRRHQDPTRGPTRVSWRPGADADFARSVGLSSSGPRVELPCDAVAVTVDDGPDDTLAVNVVVVGTAPDRLRWRTRSAPLEVSVDDRVVHDGPATGVLVANGEFLRGADVVPRGHPGDGRLEVQVYAVPPAQRGALRRRLPTGSHVPHPSIRQASGRSVTVRFGTRTWPLELDGVAIGSPRASVRMRVIERAFVLVP